MSTVSEAEFHNASGGNTRIGAANPSPAAAAGKAAAALQEACGNVRNPQQNPHYGRITSFSLRGSRLGDKYAQLMAQRGAEFTLDFPRGFAVSTISPDAVIDLDQVFGRAAPLVVEIGPGSGEQLVHGALTHPDWNFLAFEAWAPGVARCVHNAVGADVKNVRIAELDAAQALPIVFGSELAPQMRVNPGDSVGAGSAESCDNDLSSRQRRQQYAAEVWTFFPDPWRKKKHRKRRIVSPGFAQTVASVLKPGGVWRMATDWANYAWQMRDVIAQSPWFDLRYAGENIDPADEGLYAGGFAPRFSGRVYTRFEERGIEAGRITRDIVAVRNSLPVFAAKVPQDPWADAAARGIEVLADRGGEREPSSRSGFLKAQRAKRKLDLQNFESDSSA